MGKKLIEVALLLEAINKEHEDIAAQALPQHVPDTDLPEQALGFRVQLYGMTKHRDLSPRASS